MKKLNLIIVIFVGIITISSCKKVDPAPAPATSCTTVCQNGGTVNQSCGCNCPTGFTGSDCGTALPLVSVTITRIIVNNYPTSTHIGQVAYYWDAGSTSSKYPDIYINIHEGTSSVATATSAIYNNVNSVPQTYALVPVTLYHTSNNYSIGLYDNDASPDADDFMGGIYFRPIDFKAGYPQTIHLSAGNIDYTVYVIWNF